MKTELYIVIANNFTSRPLTRDQALLCIEDIERNGRKIIRIWKGVEVNLNELRTAAAEVALGREQKWIEEQS